MLPGLSLSGLLGSAGFSNIDLVLTATSTTAAITWPTGIQKGDLAILWEYVRQSNGGTYVVPSDFNVIRKSGFNASAEAGSVTSWKILNGTETGTLTGSTGTSAVRKIMGIFRPNAEIQNVQAVFVAETTNWQNPAVITYPIAGMEGPLLLLSSSGSTSSIQGKTSTPPQNAMPTPSSTFQASWLFYPKGSIVIGNPTYDSADSGDSNINQASYLVLR